MEIPVDYFGKSYKPAIDGKYFTGRKEIIGNITTTRSFKDMMGEPTEGYWLRNENWFFQWNVTKSEKKLFNMKTDSNNDYDLAQFNQELVQLYTENIQQWKNNREINAHSRNK